MSFELEDEEYGYMRNNLADILDVNQIKAEAKENIKSQSRPLTEVRKELTEITKFISNQREQLIWQRELEGERKLPHGTFNMLQCFFIDSFEHHEEIFDEMEKDRHFGLMNENDRPIMAKRFVFPILGFNREVLGFIGYNKFSEVKYILSKTIGFGKLNMFFGMHMMSWIYSKGYVIVVEGIIDAVWFWTKDIPAISLNGNAISPFVVQILKRFGYHVLFIPDNDVTGSSAIKYWQSQVPNASTLYLTKGKDPDETRQLLGEDCFAPIIEDFLFNADVKNKMEFSL